jgi:hypothetical protein
MFMHLIRKITVAGFVADADPNVTSPAAGKVYTMSGAAGDQLGAERGIEGHRLCFRFIDTGSSNAEVPAGTCSFRTWVKDDGASADLGHETWCALAAETGAGHASLYAAPLKGKIFPQVTALSASTATEVWVYIEEATSVEG